MNRRELQAYRALVDKEGHAFVLYLADRFRFRGADVEVFTTLREQLDLGDMRINGVLVEVKFQRRLHELQSHFIEIAGRSFPWLPWSKGGIAAPSAFTRFISGNYNFVQIFDRADLQREVGHRKIKTIDMDTGRGYVLSVRDARAIALGRPLTWPGLTWDGQPITDQPPGLFPPMTRAQLAAFAERHAIKVT